MNKDLIRDCDLLQGVALMARLAAGGSVSLLPAGARGRLLIALTTRRLRRIPWRLPQPGPQISVLDPQRVDQALQEMLALPPAAPLEL